MGFIEIGSQSSDSPRTPTLRQWYKDNPDEEVVHCRIKTIFNPGVYASYTFITEQNFKVSVEKNTPLSRVLERDLPGLCHAGSTLYVEVTDKAKGKWTLASVEGSITSWEERDWGFVAKEVEASKPVGTKTGTNVRKTRTHVQLDLSDQGLST